MGIFYYPSKLLDKGSEGTMIFTDLRILIILKEVNLSK